MEYLIGSIVTISLFFIYKRMSTKIVKTNRILSFRYSQSDVFELIKPFVDFKSIKVPLVSQASKYQEKQHIRVLIANHKAYWITNNIFYEADEVNGFIDKDSAKPVDIMGMDKIQLSNMMMIVETLTEGAGDENWNSGK